MDPPVAGSGAAPLPGTSAEPWHATTAEANSASTIIRSRARHPSRKVCTDGFAVRRRLPATIERSLVAPRRMPTSTSRSVRSFAADQRSAKVRLVLVPALDDRALPCSKAAVCGSKAAVRWVR